MKIQSSLEMCNVLRRFILSFLPVAALLNKQLFVHRLCRYHPLPAKKVSSACLKCLLTIRLDITLVLPTVYYMFNIGACHELITHVLLQSHPGGLARKSGYRSKVLNKRERNRTTTIHEYPAVVWAILLLRLSLYGYRFTA